MEKVEGAERISEKTNKIGVLRLIKRKKEEIHKSQIPGIRAGPYTHHTCTERIMRYYEQFYNNEFSTLD